MTPRGRNDSVPNDRARSYDEVAPAYERVSAHHLFDPPARELVAFAAPPRAARVLDVGTGTGAAAHAASAAVGNGGFVAGVDLSPPMLEGAARRGLSHLVIGRLPDLPFVDCSFDLVLSAFVLTHLDDPGATAREMKRVLRPAGRVALAAWGSGLDEFGTAWSEVAHEFVDPARLAETVRRVLPGEERFAAPGGQEGLLRAAGFDAVEVRVVALEFALSVDDWVESREVGATGRALRALLDSEQWLRYRARARDVLNRRFPSGVRYRREVLFARGRREK